MVTLLKLLINGMEKPMEMLKTQQRRADKFAEYTVKKALTVLEKINKLHEDLHIEFEADMNTLLQLIYSYPPTQIMAKEMALPREFEI